MPYDSEMANPGLSNFLLVDQSFTSTALASMQRSGSRLETAEPRTLVGDATPTTTPTTRKRTANPSVLAMLWSYRHRDTSQA